MDERPYKSEEEGEFGDEGNPPDARAPRGGGVEEFAGEANPPGIRPSDQGPASGEDVIEEGAGSEDGDLEARREDRAGRPTNE